MKGRMLKMVFSKMIGGLLVVTFIAGIYLVSSVDSFETEDEVWPKVVENGM